MHIVVIGAGIVGTVTALRLIEEGHSVQLLEASQAPAMGASHANAGLISPGHCFSWAEPGIVGAALRSLVGSGDGIGICQPWQPSMLRWALLFAKEATRARWTVNSQAALELSSYSRDLQFSKASLSEEQYGGRHAGILYLYDKLNTPSPYDANLLNEFGEKFQAFNAKEIIECEPFLSKSSMNFSTAVYSPNDGTGDAARFAIAALEKAISLGAKANFSEKVTGFKIENGKVVGVITTQAVYTADAAVVAAGLSSREMLSKLGYRLPIYSVSGYSITYSNIDGQLPRVGCVSIPHKIAWASFGNDTLRFTGFADIGVPSKKRAEKRISALIEFSQKVSSGLSKVQPNIWLGQRPMTPDNLPFLGESNHPNLFLNCGHGAMGWTMACGSAAVIADLIAGHAPRIDLAPYRWNRYSLLTRRGNL